MSKRIPVAYVIGKYRAETHRQVVENIRAAEAVAIHLWQLGFAVICPHMNSALLSGICDELVFMRGYAELLKRSDIAVVLPNASDSTGSKDEVITAYQLRKKVVGWEDHDSEPGEPSYATGEELLTFLTDFQKDIPTTQNEGGSDE